MPDALSARQHKNLLFDFYGNMLTAKQREIYTLHTAEDCSLAEIGQEMGITPQGAADILRRATGQLEKYETNLGMVKTFTEIEKILVKLDSVKEISEDVKNIRELLGIYYGI